MALYIMGFEKKFWTDCAAAQWYGNGMQLCNLKQTKVYDEEVTQASIEHKWLVLWYPEGKHVDTNKMGVGGQGERL